MLSMPLFLTLFAVVMFLGLTRPPQVLVGLSFLFVWFHAGYWDLGVRLDTTDLALLGLLLSLNREKQRVDRPRVQLPYRATWILLGLLISIAFVAAPMNQDYLGDPLRIIYQVYRNGWKHLLLFPIAVLVLHDKARVKTVLYMIVLAADIVAASAVAEGYAGERAGGIFGHGNGLGAALLAPMVLVVGLLLTGAKPRWFCIGSFVLIARALLFAGSRGAFTGVLFGCCVLAFLAGQTAQHRRRLILYVVMGVLLAASVIVVNPAILDRPNVRRFATIFEPGDQETLHWRMTTRWGYFLNKAFDYPWLGVGSEMDLALGPNANTPHNTYLAVAMRSGIPAALLFILFGLRALLCGWRTTRKVEDPEIRAYGSLSTACVGGVMVHGIVEGNLQIYFVMSLFWLFVGISIASWKTLGAEGADLADTKVDTGTVSGHTQRPAAHQVVPG